jgi:hypothetical protein
MNFFRYLIHTSTGLRGTRQDALEQALVVSGRRLRDSVQETDRRVAHVEAGLSARLAGMRRSEGEWVARGVESLRLELIPMCGAGSTDRVLRLAARRCAGADISSLTEAQWPAFLSHLSPILASLCGATAVHAVMGESAIWENFG